MEIVLDLLEIYKSDCPIVLIGSENGAKARQSLELDKKDLDDNNYIIEINDDVKCVSLSFLYPLFKDSYEKMTLKQMTDKYVLRYKTDKGHKQKMLVSNYKEVLGWVKGGQQ